MAELPRPRSRTNSEEHYVIRHGPSVLLRTTSEDFGNSSPKETRRERPSKPPPLAPKPQLSRPGSTSSLSSIGKNKARSRKAKDVEIEESLRRIRGQGKYVKLNVGGSLHYTTLATLTKHDNMLRAMFSERIPLEKDEEGEHTHTHPHISHTHTHHTHTLLLLLKTGSNFGDSRFFSFYGTDFGDSHQIHHKSRQNKYYKGLSHPVR